MFNVTNLVFLKFNTELIHNMVDHHKNMYADTTVKYCSSKKLSRATKMKFYKTVIKPVVLYAADKCVQAVEMKSNYTFWEANGEKDLRANQINRRDCRGLENNEISKILEGDNIMKLAKDQRLRRQGHLVKQKS